MTQSYEPSTHAFPTIICAPSSALYNLSVASPLKYTSTMTIEPTNSQPTLEPSLCETALADATPLPHIIR
jgi:hypothetical protein